MLNVLLQFSNTDGQMKHLTAANMYRKTIKTTVTGLYCTRLRDYVSSQAVFIHRTLSKQEGFSSAAQKVLAQERSRNQRFCVKV